MIITGGTLRSRKLSVPAGLRTRPTPARVKEALFSILLAELPDARVLDLYAGSGALGFEALSRGAAHAVFVESHAPTAVAICETARRFKIVEHCTVVVTRVERCIARMTGAFDLVFADPPYVLAPPVQVFAALAQGGFLSARAVIAYEHAAKQTSLELPPELELLRSELWGETGFHLLRKVSGHSEFSE